MSNPIDKRTSARGYPLPNSANLLQDDVLRMQSALTQIDSDIGIVPMYLATPPAPPGGQFRLYTLQGEGLLRAIDSHGTVHVVRLST